MRKLSFLFSLVFLFSIETFGQTWTRLQSWGLDLESLFWVNDSVGYAGGENLLIKTSDSGQSWQELPVVFEGRIHAIHFLDADVGIAVGENSLILKTQNGGNSWNPITLSGNYNWEDITHNGNGNWLIAGEGGYIFQSIDEGSSWQEVESGISENLKSIKFLNQDTVYSSGEKGIILRSYDGGNSWEKLNSGISTGLNDIQFSSDLIGYAVGDGGIAIKTIDGGEIWQSLATGVTSNLNEVDIYERDPRAVLIIGENATALRSGNSGASFSKINLGTTNTRNLFGIGALPESALLYVVGQDGYIIYSNNFGARFYHRFGGYRIDFTSLDFKTTRVGYIGGEGFVFVTTNGGSTLVDRSIPFSMDINSINFWNNGIGYVSGPSGKIFKTTNSGTAWTDISLNSSNDISGIYLNTSTNVDVSGAGGLIANSIDAGANWSMGSVSNSLDNLIDLTVFESGEKVAISKEGHIFHTYDGNGWENVNLESSYTFNDLAKVSGESAIIVGNNGLILKTEDDGKSFTPIESGTNEDLFSADFFDKDYGFIAGEKGVTLATKDGGLSWVLLESGTTRNLNGVSAGSRSVAFAVGEDGTILSFNCTPPEDLLGEISGTVNSCLDIQSYSISAGEIPGTQLNWRVDGGDIISGQGTNTIEVNWKDVGRKGVFVDRRNFCGSGETSYIEVIVSDLPSPDEPISGNGNVCQSQNEIYQMPELEGISYLWTVEGGEILDGQGTASLTVNWNTTGSGMITVTPENPCGKAETISLPISINPLPEEPSEVTGESLVAFGEQVYSVEAEEGISYQWNLSGGGTIISGQGTSSIQVIWQEEGDYVLQVKGQNSCDDGPIRDLAVKVSLITGIEPGPDLKGLKIYPNPSHGRFVVEAEFLDQWNEAVLITSFGQILTQSTILLGQRKLEFNDLKPGLYYLRLDGHDGSVVRKVLIR